MRYRRIKHTSIGRYRYGGLFTWDTTSGGYEVFYLSPVPLFAVSLKHAVHLLRTRAHPKRLYISHKDVECIETIPLPRPTPYRQAPDMCLLLNEVRSCT